MVDFLVAVSMIAMFGGIGLFFLSGNFGEKGSKMRTAAVYLFIGGMIGGCFATPSRGMPNGMPGALAASMVFIAVGIIRIVAAFVKKPSDESAGEKKMLTNKVLVFVAIAVFVIFIAAAFATSPSGSSNEPWRELGVSKKEYMDIYNYYKYGK